MFLKSSWWAEGGRFPLALTFVAAASIARGALAMTPPNDECEGAIPIGLGATGFCTLGASCELPDLPETCNRGFGLSLASTIWFSFTAPKSGTYCLSTCDLADFDTRLAVYSGSCGDLVLLECNDDGVGCSGFTSELTFSALGGETLLLRIGGYDSAGCGTLLLSANSCPSCPSSDHDCGTVGGPGCADAGCCILVCALDPFCCDFAWDGACVSAASRLPGCGGGYSCSSGLGAPSNDCAPNHIPLSCPSLLPFDTTKATTDGPPISCDLSKDIWYSVDTPSISYLKVTVSATFDPVIAIYDLGPFGTLDPNSLASLLVGCGNSSSGTTEMVSIGATQADHRYLIQVAGAGAGGTESGGGTLKIECEEPLFSTGPNTPARYDPDAAGDFSQVNVGFATGDLTGSSEPVWFATPFDLPSIESRAGWHVREIHVLGCIPGAADCVSGCAPKSGDCAPGFVANETMDLIIWSRTAFSAPTDGDQIAAISVPFPVGFDMLDAGVKNEDLLIQLPEPLFLPAGNYWLTAYAGGSGETRTPAAFVWLTNTTGEGSIPNLDRADDPFILRSESFPVPGFQAYSLDAAQQLAPAEGASRGQGDRLYTTALIVIGDDESDCVSRGKEKLTQVKASMSRAKSKTQKLSVAMQAGVQELTEQMYGQFANSDSLVNDALGQLELADGIRLPCDPGDIDIKRVIAKLEQLRSLIENAMGTADSILVDDCVDESELDEALVAYASAVDPALVLIDLLIQQLAGCPQDLNGDAQVDVGDLSSLLDHWGSPGTGDFDESGGVDGSDLAVLLGAWGDCPE